MEQNLPFMNKIALREKLERKEKKKGAYPKSIKERKHICMN